MKLPRLSLFAAALLVACSGSNSSTDAGGGATSSAGGGSASAAGGGESMTAGGGASATAGGGASSTAGGGMSTSDGGTLMLDAGSEMDAGPAEPIAIAGGTSCTSLPDLEAGAYVLSFAGTTGTLTDYTGACRANFVPLAALGAEQLFAVTIPAGGALRVRVESDDDTIEPVIVLADTCETLTSACAVQSASSASWLNPSAEERTVAVAIDPQNESAVGEVELSVEIVTAEEIPQGNLCSTPIPLGGVGGYTVSGDTSAFFNAYNEYGGSEFRCSTEGQGPENIYAIDVPAGHRVRVTTNTGFDNVRYGVFRSCADAADFRASCLDYSSGNYISANTTGEDQSWFFVVDGRFADSQGAYEVFVVIDETP